MFAKTLAGSFIDPLGLPTVTAGSDNYFHTSVRPYPSKSSKTKHLIFTLKIYNDRYWQDC